MLQLDSNNTEKDKAFIPITHETPPLPVFVTPTSLECNIITWESLLGKKKEVNLVANNAEVSYLTRSGKVNQPPGEVSKENPLSQMVSEDEDPKDPVLTQMKKTNVNISIWGLLCVSKKHRDAFSKSLAQDVVVIDTSPFALTQMIGNIHFGNVIVFSELDIPKGRTEHTDALNIAVDY